MPRRKKKKRRGKRRRAPGAARGHRLRATLEAVEFARGHDGLLRGKPEPVLLFAAFAPGCGGAVLVERALRRLAVTEPYPSVTEIVKIPERELFRAEVPLDASRAVVLAVAVEEDAGQDVESIYAGLSAVGDLSLWFEGEALPQPLGLDELLSGSATSPPEAQPVHLIQGGSEVGASCRADDWVGAALVVTELDTSHDRLWRFRFVSRDELNDWTALVRIRF